MRDYDPGTGRYVESDPIGLGGGLNPYVYANGNPLRWIDVFGLYTAEELANIIFNETESLSGPGIHEARIAVGQVAVNRERPGRVDTGIAPAKLTKRARDALANEVAAVVNAYSDAKSAAADAQCRKDDTGGAKGFVIKGNSLKEKRYGRFPVLQQFGPFNNSNATQDLPATGVYINTFAE